MLTGMETGMQNDFRVKMKPVVAVLVMAAGAGIAVHLAMAQEGSKATPSTKKVIKAGETWTLIEDFVLTGADSLEVNGTVQKPCTIVASGHAIRTQGEWTGALTLVHCQLKGLGTPSRLENGRLVPGAEALNVAAAASAEVVVEHCVFDGCNALTLVTNGRSSARFRNNTVLENALIRVEKAAHLSQGFFSATGNSPAPKLFQGNRVYKGGCLFKAPNWLVGGDTDADSNIFIGMRAGIVASGEGTVVRGNYVHVLLYVDDTNPYWSQVSTFSGNCLAEKNVVRSGHWVIRGIAGEFRYNLVVEVHGHTLLQAGTARLHHNIFAHPCPLPDSKMNPRPIGGVSAINLLYKTDALDVFNNVIVGPGIGLAVELGPDAFMPTLRNNVFYDFRGKWVVGPGANENPVPAAAERLGYADYNCFFSPNAPAIRNYAVGVKGKTERKDAGFALNDLPRGGKVDEQCDPGFKGPVPEKFPFDDEEIKTGKVTVSQMLNQYRDAFTPARDSPLIDAGDPADGEGTDIGAVDAGKPAKVRGF
jgi:hypothetical protein